MNAQLKKGNHYAYNRADQNLFGLSTIAFAIVSNSSFIATPHTRTFWISAPFYHVVAMDIQVGQYPQKFSRIVDSIRRCRAAPTREALSVLRHRLKQYF
jgi:hypothetical protein